jgi:hypothetical protein
VIALCVIVCLWPTSVLITLDGLEPPSPAPLPLITASRAPVENEARVVWAPPKAAPAASLSAVPKALLVAPPAPPPLRPQQPVAPVVPVLPNSLGCNGIPPAAGLRPLRWLFLQEKQDQDQRTERARSNSAQSPGTRLCMRPG